MGQVESQVNKKAQAAGKLTRQPLNSRVNCKYEMDSYTRCNYTERIERKTVLKMLHVPSQQNVRSNRTAQGERIM
jgi:hypothetical protein